jgi:CRISPR-associated protein Cas1
MTTPGNEYDERSTLPVRMLNEFAYCPRLFYLEHVQGEWADSADTIEGRLRHRRVDAREQPLLEPGEGDASGERIHARSVSLADPELRLVAKIDLVEADGGDATPVDYKRGSAPDTPDGAFEPERVQSCAQGLLLRAHGYRSERGVLYFVESKTRVVVKFDEPLVARTLALRDQALDAARSDQPPPPLVNSPKCVRCSLAPLCLPDETNLLAGVDVEEPRRLAPARDDALPVLVQTQGASVGVSAERLTVKHGREVLSEVRLLDVSDVAVFGGVQVSTAAVRELVSRDIPVAYFSQNGWFYAFTIGMSHKNVLLRQAQYRVADDAERSLTIARELIRTKIRNQRTLIRRNHREPPPELLHELSRMATWASRAESAEQLLGIEGNAARLYFSAFAGMLKGELSEEGPSFEGRNRRPPKDPVNALLSFCYALLVKDIALTLQRVGFDPLLGVLHRPRYGRPALALDLMEELRPLVADSVVVTVINNGVLQASDFVRGAGGVSLKPAGRKALMEAYGRRMDELVTHPSFGYRISYRRIVEVQARLLGRHLLGELSGFTGFRTR